MAPRWSLPQASTSASASARVAVQAARRDWTAADGAARLAAAEALWQAWRRQWRSCCEGCCLGTGRLGLCKPLLSTGACSASCAAAPVTEMSFGSALARWRHCKVPARIFPRLVLVSGSRFQRVRMTTHSLFPLPLCPHTVKRRGMLQKMQAGCRLERYLQF